MLIQCIAGCAIVLVTLLLVLGLVRLAADLALLLLAISGCVFVAYNISFGLWLGWDDVLWQSLATGGATGLLSLPILPFSSLYRGRR